MGAFSNLLTRIPTDLPEELTEILLSAADVRIERIVSHGHASAPEFWYDQDQHEWVVILKGAAKLRFEDEIVEMKSGDFINIPAHKRHRVDWTTPEEPTIWLAVFYGGRSIKAKTGDKIRTNSITREGNLELARNIVLEFVKLSYNSASWEKLVSLAKLQPHGCLIDVLAIECPFNRRTEAAFYAANALRRGRFQSLTRGRAEWERKIWTDEEINAVIQIVENAVRECLERPEPRLNVSQSKLLQPPRSPVEVGTFVPWRLFCDREPVAEAEGVYVFATFEVVPEQVVDPTCKEVIYIGVTEGQTLRTRLQQFEDTALGGSGHSGGWSYRIDHFPEDWEKLQTFHHTYVTWIVVPKGGPETPRELEYRLKNLEYAERWGRLPVLNKV